MFWNGFPPTSAPTSAFMFFLPASASNMQPEGNEKRSSHPGWGHLQTLPCAVQTHPATRCRSATLGISTTHTHTDPPAHPMSQGKQQRWRKRARRVGRPPAPAESACQLGKARWKQSHMMAALAVAQGGGCSHCRPSWLVLAQPPCAGGWVWGGCQSQHSDAMMQKEAESEGAAAAARRDWRKLSAAL